MWLLKIRFKEAPVYEGTFVSKALALYAACLYRQLDGFDGAVVTELESPFLHVVYGPLYRSVA